MIQLFLLDINVINDYEIMENGDKNIFFPFHSNFKFNYYFLSSAY
jgi:hypothetical protein